MKRLAPHLPDRPPDSHKGSFGHVLVVAGSRNMPGAAALTAMAAGRGGAGLVTVATPAGAQPVVAGFAPWYMTAPMPESEDGGLDERALARILALAGRATVIAMGPGLGTGAGVAAVVRELYVECPLPMVVDADALNVLAADPPVWSHHRGPRVLTPHPGELRRILGGRAESGTTSEASGQESALQVFLDRTRVVAVAKGHRTLVTDGSTEWRCERANSSLATGGAGDVLTGLVAAMLAQGLAPLTAAVTGCALHSLAGEIAAAGAEGCPLVATDLVAAIPAAWRAAAQQWSPP